MYIPGHSVFFGYLPDGTEPTPGASGYLPDLFPALSSSPTMLGYTNALPEFADNLNNDIGYSLGAVGGVYKKKGAVAPEVTVPLTSGALPFLKSACLRENLGPLPYIALFYGVQGRYTNVIRRCKCASIELTFKATSGQSGEIIARPTFWGTGVQSGTPLTLTAEQIRGFGIALTWHNIRTFNIENAVGVNQLLLRLQSLSIRYDNQLERKGERPNWGEHNATSRTSYAILEHQFNVGASVTLDEQLPASLIRQTVSSQDWGDVVISANDADSSTGLPQHFTATLSNTTPTSPVHDTDEVSGQVSHTVGIKATGLSLTASVPI